MNFEPDDLADLVEKVACSGDREAYTILFGFFAPRIKALLLKLQSEPRLAEEVTQETMTTLWQKAGLFDRSKSSVATWLYRIARNRFIDSIRRAHGIEITIDDTMLLIDDTIDPDAKIDAERRADRMKIALAALPGEQRDIIQMTFFEGLTQVEIAERTGIPLGTIKSRTRLAYTRLRRAIEADRSIDNP